MMGMQGGWLKAEKISTKCLDLPMMGSPIFFGLVDSMKEKK
jgi:hypothetical protein|tara:strand:+ start:1920 stop:2042 length:123 start_codon:yes stop_codon:yes gene_type:complete